MVDCSLICFCMVIILRIVLFLTSISSFSELLSLVKRLWVFSRWDGCRRLLMWLVRNGGDV